MSSPRIVGAGGEPLAPAGGSPQVELAQVHPFPRLQAARLLAGLPKDAPAGALPVLWRLELVMQTGLRTGKALHLELPLTLPGRELARSLRGMASYLDQLADDCAPAPQDAVSAAPAELEPGA